MYEELVKRLRDSEHEIDCSLCDRDCCYPDGNVHGKCIIIEAADAIEELSRLHEAQRQNLIVLMNEEPEPKWIPVTERLPEDGSLTGKLIADSDGEIRIAGQYAEITLKRGKTVYTDLVDLVSFLAEDLPTIEWDDCTHITHWMSLPEPPKEGE